MGEKKVTVMVLKVDLQCSKCYKKVKKVLCKFPQIQDQVFDEKTGTVTIKVVCCSPEKIRDKLCCKGEGSIKSIEILPPPPPPAEKPKDKPKPPPDQKPKDPEKPKPKSEPEKPKQPVDKPKVEPEKPKPQPEAPPKEPEKPKGQPEKPPKVTFAEPTKPSPPPPPASEPVPGYPPAVAPVGGLCCRECYNGHGGGPCYQQLECGQVRYYDGYYGRPVYDSWGGGCAPGAAAYRSRCTDYISEENPAAPCTIM